MTSITLKYATNLTTGDWGCQVRGGTGAEWAEVEWNCSGMDGIDNKIGITLASAHALCLDLLSCVWLRISGGMSCYQEFQRGMV